MFYDTDTRREKALITNIPRVRDWTLLIGLPKYQIDRLQSVLNTAARIITFTCKYDHITPVLVRLHWLPVSYRIRFKVLLLTYKVLVNDLSAEYISEVLNKPKYTRNLRSLSQHLLSVLKSRTVTYGDRAFPVCTPKLWTELPFHLRISTNIQEFKSGLETTPTFRWAFALLFSYYYVFSFVFFLVLFF